MFREGTAIEALESVDSRRFLPQALLATFAVIVAPALIVVALSPLSGIADLLLSALLATGLSVAAGSVGSALWTRLAQSREIPFGDLMLWAWARRVRAERRLAKTAAGGAPLGRDGELATLRTLAVVYEARDGFSHGHSGRVARHAERIARRLGLAQDEIERIEAAAAVHDVGMLRVPSAVAGAAADSPEARALVERHAVHGAEQVAAVADPEIAALVRHHHERVDGGGYPDGLAGDEIPLGARIIAVADRFDELASPAPGRGPRSRRNALDELSARAGSELDAAVVAAFLAYYSGVRSIAGVALAATAPQRAVRWIAAAPATIGSAAGAPVVLQSMCAAGTAVLAGACMTGLPALDPRGGDGQGQQAEQRAERAPVGGAGGGGATRIAAAAPARPKGGAGSTAPAGSRAADDPAAPRSGRQQAPTAQGDRGGGTPVAQAPPSAGGGDGGSQPTVDGGGGGGGSGGGGGGGGTGGEPTAPPTAHPSTPTTPTTPAPAPTPPPPAPVNPTSQVVDPILDGVGEAVPPVKPITDAVKGIVGGLTGGLTGGGQQP